MTNDSEDGTTRDGTGVEGDSAEAEFAESLRKFAEGATALTAASIRMQMMMLEQARGMMDDLARAGAEASGRAPEASETEPQGGSAGED